MQKDVSFRMPKPSSTWLAYVVARAWMSLAAAYMLVTIILSLVWHIDIGIPCLWKHVFEFTCPGCGLTRAFIQLIQFKLQAAWNCNPLIFLVLPFGMYYVVIDYRRFMKKNQALKSEQIP
jgi:hypothetical protein